MTFLNESLARGDRFETELAGADQKTRLQLLSAWKEQLGDQFLSLLKITDDVGTLANIDRTIALSMDIERSK